MSQRLVWNFEYTSIQCLPLTTFVDIKDDHVTWEIRYFWPDSELIILNTIDPSLTNITDYQQKHNQDRYYLLPNQPYNIKKRNDQLFYKPLLEKTRSAVGFGAKIRLTSSPESNYQNGLTHPDILKIMQQITKESVEVTVKKETLHYIFPTKPKTKLELARLEVENKIYFSLCIEGRSLNLVETISQNLLKQYISCDYVTFLKKLMKLS